MLERLELRKDFLWGIKSTDSQSSDDIILMKNLQIKACSFPISWSRIMPWGIGQVDEDAVIVYREMLMQLRLHGIMPVIILLENDCPRPLHNKGGWLNSDMVTWFAEYAGNVADRFSDLCDTFITVSKPQLLIDYTDDVQLVTDNIVAAHEAGVVALRERAAGEIKIGFSVECMKKDSEEFVNRMAVSDKADFIGIDADGDLDYSFADKYLRECGLPIYVTEGVTKSEDTIAPDGMVHDNERINNLDKRIGALFAAMDRGLDIRGYFVAVFLDDMYDRMVWGLRSGIVYVDFASEQRIVKDSAFWYQKVIDTNGGCISYNQIDREIIFLNPVCTHNIWGGSRLREQFGYKYQGDDLGECWGISAHPNGDGTIKYGNYAGMTLSNLWEQHPEVFGNLDYDRFPLLIKIIDAKDDLSIQVHPDDSYARVHENGSYGKTECWYVLDCPEDAALVIGHNANTREELESMISEGRWDEFIREVPVKKGDFIQIDPGTVHAIKGGLLILETQQNSDITYRVYDYDRLSDGKPRELHVSQSKDVISVPAAPVSDSVVETADEIRKNELVTLYDCDYYEVFKLNLEGRTQVDDSYPFLNVTITEGDGIISGRPVKKGDHMIIPNGFGILDMQGELEMIASTVKE